MSMYVSHDCTNGSRRLFNQWAAIVSTTVGRNVVYSSMIPGGAWCCDEIIPWPDQELLMNALSEALPKLPEEWRPATEQFIAGLRLAMERGEPVEIIW